MFAELDDHDHHHRYRRLTEPIAGELQAPATATEHKAPQTATEQAPKTLPRLRSPRRRFPRANCCAVPGCGARVVRAVQIAGKIQAPPTAMEQDKEENIYAAAAVAHAAAVAERAAKQTTAVQATSSAVSIPPHKQLLSAEQKLFRATAAMKGAQEDEVAMKRAKLAMKDAQEERLRALAAISACAFAELEARDKATAAPASSSG